MATVPYNTIYTLESVNLICGDVGNQSTPGNSTHLQLMELKLPALEEAFQDHYPGGAPVGIEVNTMMTKLEATFSLAGLQPEIMTMIGKSNRWNQVFTAYGLVRDRRTGAALAAKAVIQGRLGRVNPTAFRKGDVMNHEYSIRAIVHYEFYMATSPGAEALEEIYFWDFFSYERRIGNENMNVDEIRLLAIPGVTSVGGGPE